MATWSSFEKDRLLAENWRKFVKDNPEDKSSQTVFGINSEDNTESLLSFLEKNQEAIGLTRQQVDQLVALMLAQTKEDDVVLEAIGGPQRDARTFSSETTTKLNTLIDSFDLGAANKKKLEKVLNRWAKLNTVSFEQGAASAPAPTPAEPPSTEEPDEDKPATVESKLPIVITMNEVVDYITSSDKFLEDIKKLFDKLPDKKYKFKNIEEIKELFSDFPLVIFDYYSHLLSHEESPTAKYIKLQKTTNEIKQAEIKQKFDTGNPKFDLLYFVFGVFLRQYIKIRSKKIPNLSEEAIKILDKSIVGLNKRHLISILQNANRDDASIDDKGEAETVRIQPAPEPVSEPQATEEPLKIITKILGEKGVDKEKVSAFMNDLREMGVIQEMAPRTLKRNLKMNKAEWAEFSQKHPEVIEAISQLRGRSKKDKALQAQFKDALSGIIAREIKPNMPRRRRKKKSTAAPESKNDSTPAAETPAEPAPQAVPEPAPAPEPPESEPKRKKKGPPPAKNQEAYKHGKQGKSMNRDGSLIDKTVQSIEKAIDGLLKVKAGSDNEELRNKIDSYIRGLDEYKPPTKLNESLMLRWKTIAGIK